MTSQCSYIESPRRNRSNFTIFSTITDRQYTHLQERNYNKNTLNDLLFIHNINGLVYSVFINISIIIFTTIGLVYNIPLQSDALDGLIFGIIGAFVGVIIGWPLQKIVYFIVINSCKLDIPK
jgi:hypothetical protein